MTIHITIRNPYGHLTRMKGRGGTKEEWEAFVKRCGWEVVEMRFS